MSNAIKPLMINMTIIKCITRSISIKAKDGFSFCAMSPKENIVTIWNFLQVRSKQSSHLRYTHIILQKTCKNSLMQIALNVVSRFLCLMNKSTST